MQIGRNHHNPTVADTLVETIVEKTIAATEEIENPIDLETCRAMVGVDATAPRLVVTEATAVGEVVEGVGVEDKMEDVLDRVFELRAATAVSDIHFLL